MAAVKVTISVPKELYEASSLRAKRDGISRSELFVTAMEQMLRTRRRTRVAGTWDLAYSQPETDEETSARRGAMAAMKRLAKGRA